MTFVCVQTYFGFAARVMGESLMLSQSPWASWVLNVPFPPLPSLPPPLFFFFSCLHPFFLPPFMSLWSELSHPVTGGPSQRLPCVAVTVFQMSTPRSQNQVISVFLRLLLGDIPHVPWAGHRGKAAAFLATRDRGHVCPLSLGERGEPRCVSWQDIWF